MKIVEIPIDRIKAPLLNANVMDLNGQSKLRRSIQEFGFLNPMVLRPMGDETYETVGGAHRLEVAKGLGYTELPCVVVKAGDSKALLLSQALNRIHGEDNIGLRAETLQRVLKDYSEKDILELLPETSESLQGLSSLGTESLAEGLSAWNAAQKVKLNHLTFQVTDEQLRVVEKALVLHMPGTSAIRSNPNKRGNALYKLCESYLETTSS